MAYPTFDFVSGPYTATYNGSSVGATSEGFRIRKRMHVQKIQTDQTGDVAVEGINMGAEYEIEFDGIEFAKLQAAMDTHTPDGETVTNVGTLQTSLAKSLVLTPITAGTNKKTYTATKAIVESDVDFMVNKGLKHGRITFTLYPDTSTGKAYTTA